MQYKKHTYLTEVRAEQRGFTLLLASLVASVVLVLGASIFALATKEVTLSALGRDSQFAFYAADGAAECALYWDVRHPTPLTDTLFSTATAPTTLTCDTQAVSITTGGSWPEGVTFTFRFDPNGKCARVVVTKKATNPVTTIDASGYNVSCADLDAGSDRALERSVQLHY